MICEMILAHFLAQDNLLTLIFEITPHSGLLFSTFSFSCIVNEAYRPGKSHGNQTTLYLKRKTIKWDGESHSRSFWVIEIEIKVTQLHHLINFSEIRNFWVLLCLSSHWIFFVLVFVYAQKESSILSPLFFVFFLFSVRNLLFTRILLPSSSDHIFSQRWPTSGASRSRWSSVRPFLPFFSPSCPLTVLLAIKNSSRASSSGLCSPRESPMMSITISTLCTTPCPLSKYQGPDFLCFGSLWAFLLPGSSKCFRKG